MPKSTYTELQDQYGGQFVALRDGEVVGTGKTYGELLAAVHQAAFDRTHLAIEYIEPPDGLRAY